MPKVDPKKAGKYKRNLYTQQWAEGRYTKNNSGKSKDNDSDDDREGVSAPRAPLSHSTSIKAPGILVNCVRGKEKNCGQELLEIFNTVSTFHS
jgi:hypothetical protein